MAGQSRFRKRASVLVLGVLALAAAAAVAWEGWLEDRFIARRWGVVEAGKIYRSGQLSASLVRPMLEQHGIRVVIQMSGEDPADAGQAAERAAVRDLGLKVHHCPLVGDGTGDSEQYVSALTALVAAERQGLPSLVHCHAGSQRTGGVIALYRLLVQQRPPEEVVQEMEQFGWRRGRADVLLHYLNRHMSTIAGRLVETGVLTEVPAPLPVLR